MEKEGCALEVPMILDTHVRIMVLHPALKPLVAKLKAATTFENPEYKQAKRFSRWVSKRIPPTLRYWDEQDGWIIIPRGLGPYVFKEIKKLGFSPVVHEGRVERAVSYPALGAELRPYQQAALGAFLKYKSGLIVLPAGAGKTHVGVSAVYHSGQRTL